MGNWTFDQVIVIDLESTCWDKPEEQATNVSEIIEIGVCILDVLTGEIRNPRGLIVKPIASKISPFCTELTSIDDDMIKREGMKFEDAINILKKDYGVSRKIMGGYGNYDKHMLSIECQRQNIKAPFGPTYLNISAMATLKLKANKRLGLKKACNIFGLEFEGRAHRGVDDAVMAAKILWECIK